MFRIAMATLFIAMVFIGSTSAAEQWKTLSEDFAVNDMEIAGDYIWMAVSEGVIKWNLQDDSFELFDIGDSFSRKIPIQVAVGSDGVVWAAFFNGEFMYYDGSTWQTADIDLGGENADRMIAGPDGSIWLSIYNGSLFRYGDEELIEFSDVDGFSFQQVSSMDVGDDGSVWVCSRESGVACYKDGKWTTFEQPNLFGVAFITLDKNGSLWGSGMDDLMYRLDGNNWVQYGVMTDERVQEILLAGKTIEAKLMLNQIINLEVAYYYKNGKYAPLKYGEDLPEIDFVVPDNAQFEYKFEDGIAYARELVDFNEDGDLDDCLTLDTDKEQGALEGSSYGWGSSATHGTAQYFISAPDGSFYSRTQNSMMRYNGSAWHYIENEGFPEGYVNDIAVSPDGRLFVGGVDMLVSLDLAQTGVEEQADVPSALAILGNSPNPFNPETAISFSLPTAGNIEVAVYSISGQKISTLHSGYLPAGTHTMQWNGADDNCNSLASGIYFATLRNGSTVTTHKMMLIR